MTAAIGALAAVTLVVACASVGFALHRVRRLRRREELKEAPLEVSLCYTCTLESVGGEVCGEAYDAKQRDIRVWTQLNALALLTLGLAACGPTFNIWGDGAEDDPGPMSSGIPGDGDGDPDLPTGDAPNDVPTGDGDGDADPGDGDGDPINVWGEIRCIDQGNTMGCLGRPTGSDDAWVWVAPECTIDALDFIEVDTWEGPSCAAGVAPGNFFPENRCGALGDLSICWSGGDGWFTQSIPTCELSVDAHEPVVLWPDWRCDGIAGSVGEHPWDVIVCSEVEASPCLGLEGVSAEMVLPTCWVDQWPEVDPIDCQV